jgi:hypothetical protein
MDFTMRSVTLRTWTIWLLGATAAATLVFAGFALWRDSRDRELVRTEAEALLARVVPGTQTRAEEYAAWKALAAADPRLRVEAARVGQETRYASALSASADLLGRSVVGYDVDGHTSRALAEQLVCAPLEASPAAAATVPLYFVPWLNPAALDSEQCAQVLTESVIAAEPGAFIQGGDLLALVLSALPVETARPYVNRLIEQVAVAAPGRVKQLFNALRRVDSRVYREEFATALRTLTERIADAENAADIASLMDSVDALKYEVKGEQLTPVLDAGIARMIERNDATLTRDIYFTLADLKATHPGASFGLRPDYLIQGINIYSDAIEIYDYSRVLRLQARYPAQASVPAVAVLDAIRNLDDPDYLSGIVPYCKYYLEVSEEQDYADFLAGAQLLFEQLYRDNFIFARPCLLHSGLVDRIEEADRALFAAIVIEALTTPRSATRIAESVELLGQLRTRLNAAQLQQLSSAVFTAMSEQDDAYRINTLVGAVSRAALNFSPDFYTELFVRIVNTPVAADGRSAVAPAALLQVLPETQRAYVVATALAAFVPAQMEPAALANHVEFLVPMKQWLADDELTGVVTALVAAIEDPRNVPVASWLTRSFVFFTARGDAERGAVQAALLRHIGANSDRTELARLFEAISALGGVGGTDANGREVLRAAAIRFMEQLTPADAEAGTVGLILAKPPEEPNGPYAPAIQRIRSASRQLVLEPAEVEQISARYVHALVSESDTRPVADYAQSIRFLSLYARPRELDALLNAVHERLDSITDAATHELLVTIWIAVENSTHAQLPPQERLPFYFDVLQLPLTSATSRTQLVEAAEKLAEEDFGGNIWKLLEWRATEPATP